jgi:hypothetical protein
LKIPVFVSCPTSLNSRQELVRSIIESKLNSLGLESRSVGRTDYPVSTPLREVLALAKHCSGGVILGFSQLTIDSGISREGTSREDKVTNVRLPTPWNQIETGILFSLHLPLVVLRERNVKGGIFDHGTGDFFVHDLPDADSIHSDESLGQVLLNWQSRVRHRYYTVSPSEWSENPFG